MTGIPSKFLSRCFVVEIVRQQTLLHVVACSPRAERPHFQHAFSSQAYCCDDGAIVFADAVRSTQIILLCSCQLGLNLINSLLLMSLLTITIGNR